MSENISKHDDKGLELIKKCVGKLSYKDIVPNLEARNVLLCHWFSLLCWFNSRVLFLYLLLGQKHIC